MKYRLEGVELTAAEGMGVSSVAFITGLSITFCGDVGILGVGVPAVLTAV